MNDINTTGAQKMKICFFIFFFDIYDSKVSFLLYGVKIPFFGKWIDRIMASYHKANTEDVLLSAT